MPRLSRFVPFLVAFALASGLSAAHAGTPPKAAAPVARPAPGPHTAREMMPATDLALYDRLSARVEAAYDTTLGGYVSKDGSPSESAIELAFRNGADGNGSYWTEHALFTAHWTIGLYDSVGGGFVDRSRDAGHNTPYFMKTTVVNGRRLEMMVLATSMTGEPDFRSTASRTASYFDHVLLEGNGGFISEQVGDRGLQPLANGFAIRAWWAWAAASADPRARDFAFKSVDAVWHHCWAPDGVFIRRGPFGELLMAPQLDDQVEMGRALVLAAQLGGRADDRARATVIGELLLLKFEDLEKGGFRTRAMPTKDGHMHKAARQPDENARAARFLAELTQLTGDERYAAAARRTLHAFDERFDKLGLDAADWALAVRALSVPELPLAPAWAAVETIDYQAPRPKRYHTVGN